MFANVPTGQQKIIKHAVYLSLKSCIMKYVLIALVFIISQQATAQKLQERRMCVQKDGKLVDVAYNYNTETGDRTVTVKGSEVPFSSVYKTDSSYAKNQSWYINREKITFNGKTYAKYGLPRILGSNEVEKAGEYKKTTIFIEKGNTDHEIIYLFVQPGCEFQPYSIAVIK